MDIRENYHVVGMMDQQEGDAKMGVVKLDYSTYGLKWAKRSQQQPHESLCIVINEIG